MSDLELLADTMEEWSTTSGDHHMLAAAAIRQLIKLQASLKHTPQPVDVNQQLVEALQAVLDCGSTSDQWWIDKAREALLSAGKGGEE